MSSSKARSNNEATSATPLLFIYTFEWLNDWLPNQGISTHTIKSYRSALSLLVDYLNEKHISLASFHFGDLTREFVREWMLWQKDTKHNMSSSINTRLTALNSYLEYAASEDVSLLSIRLKIQQIHPLKTEKVIKAVLTVNQMQNLIDAIPNNKKGYRDRVMIMLMYESACRISEILNLRLSNVYCNAEYPYFKVDGKGKKQRPIPISDEMAKALQKYIELYHGDNSPQTELLFYTTYNGEATVMNARTFQILLNKYAKIASETDPTFPSKIHPHMLRRTRATHLYQNEMPFELVSSLLGHEQLETTRTYAMPSLRQMREAMNQGVISGHDEEPDWLEKEAILAKYFGIKNTKNIAKKK